LPANEADKIKLIDTGCVSISQGLFVKKAIDLIRRNSRFDHVESALIPQKKKCSMWFTVDDLHWLKRNGRVSALSAFMGSMLNIKPIIGLDNAQLVPIEKHRGKEKAIDRMIERAVESYATNGATGEIWIAHADELATAVSARDKIIGYLNISPAAIKIVEVGPTIAAHTGPGSTAIAVIDN
jgi:DegV family protein with EDD domain